MEGLKNLIVHYKKGELIYTEHEKGSTMFIVHSGKVKLFKKGLGNKEIPLGIYGKGSFIGELAVTESYVRTENAVALEDTSLIAISRAVFKTMILKNPEIAMKMIKKFSEKLKEANQIIDKLKTEDKEIKEATNVFGHLKVSGYNQSFPITMKTTLIGRYDPVIGICPDIDISSYDPQKTVSRKHALIIITDDGTFIEEEVGVINGTYLNGNKIDTGKKYKLNDKDKIHFGLVACEFLKSQ
jgi:CRP-like cAMP-binding protein